MCCLSPQSCLAPPWGQWVRRDGTVAQTWEQVRMQQKARLLILEERPSYPPPESHWSQASLSSEWQFPIGCYCLCHQSLGSQTGFSLALMWGKLALQLHSPTPYLPKFMWKQPPSWQRGLSAPPAVMYWDSYIDGSQPSLGSDCAYVE